MKRKTSEISWFVREITVNSASLDRETIMRMAQQLGIELQERGYFCAAIKYARGMTSDAELPISLYNACMAVSKRMGSDVFGYIGTDFCVVLVIAAEESKRAEKIEKLYQGLSKNCTDLVQIGVGRSYRDITKLSYSRVEAFEALGNIHGAHPVSYIDDIYILRSLTTRKMENEKRKIVEEFKHGELDQVKTRLAQLAEKVRAESPVRQDQPYPTSIRRTVVEILFEIMHVSSDAGVDVDSLLNYQDPYTHIFELQDTPTILTWFQNVANMLYSNMLELRGKKENNMLAMAKKYIDDYLGNSDLGLALVSNKLGVTPSYFSSFFIRQMGVGFNEYVTALRLERAQRLLTTTTMKVSDIAQICGFRSASYFGSVFRKQMGMAPVEYRNVKN